MNLKNGKLIVPEKEVLKGCLEYLTAIGAFVWRSNTGAFAGEYKGKKRFVRFGQPGIADIIGVMPNGRFISVECKREGGKVSLDQNMFSARVVTRRGIWICAHSVEELKAQLEKVYRA